MYRGGLRETNGPTDLTIAGINTQTFLKRSGSTIIGVDFLKSVLAADSAAIGTTPVTVAGLTLQSGGRQYIFEAHVVLVNNNATSRTTTISLAYAAGATAISGSIAIYPPGSTAVTNVAFTTVGGATLVSPALLSTTAYYAVIKGCITPTANGAFNVNVVSSSAVNTVVAKAMTYLECNET